MIKIIETTDIEYLKQVVLLSQKWEAENITYGYVQDQLADLLNKRVFIALSEQRVLGFITGMSYRSHKMKSIMPENTLCFEIEEFYVDPAFRKQSVGHTLFNEVENQLKAEKIQMITLLTANKEQEKILNFYSKKEDMQVWTTHLFKKYNLVVGGITDNKVIFMLVKNNKIKQIKIVKKRHILYESVYKKEIFKNLFNWKRLM